MADVRTKSYTAHVNKNHAHVKTRDTVHMRLVSCSARWQGLRSIWMIPSSSQYPKTNGGGKMCLLKGLSLTKQLETTCLQYVGSDAIIRISSN